MLQSLDAIHIKVLQPLNIETVVNIQPKNTELTIQTK